MRTAATLLLAVALLCPATFAQDNPAKPPAERPAHTETFLGVFTAPLDPALRAQLDLPEGVGMLVVSVAPGSPAAEAGVKTYDVLHKLDDQILVNTDQLATLVRAHKAGEKVTLTVIRKAKPVTLTAALASRKFSPPGGVIERFRRELPPRLQPDHLPRPDLRIPEWYRDFDRDLRKLPDWYRGLDEDTRRLLERHLHQWREEWPPQWPPAEVPHKQPQPDRPGDAPKPPKAHKPDQPQEPGKHQAKGDREHPAVSQFVLKTPKYTITVKGVDGKQTATIADSEGKVLHKDVPAEKWDTLPEDVQKLLKGIHIESEGHEGKIRVKV